MRPEADWFFVPVPAIIDRELFERTRRQLDANYQLCSRNRKNEYLLAGKIKCSCGRSRTGQGEKQGKHLYYRCSDRIASFPLPARCKEGGINARIADALVWERLAGLMGAEDLLSAQADRWLSTRTEKIKSSAADVALFERELATLKAQEDRYNMAFGAGLFSVGQLAEYTSPLRG